MIWKKKILHLSSLKPKPAPRAKAGPVEDQYLFLPFCSLYHSRWLLDLNLFSRSS